MKLSISTLLLAAVAAQEGEYRGKGQPQPDHGPNFCNGKQNQLKKMSTNGGPNWKCKSRQNKNKGDSKKCKGKCSRGLFSTAPKKVRCDERVGWMTKKQGNVNTAAVDASCCFPEYIAECDFNAGHGNSHGRNGPGTVDGKLTITQYRNCGDGVNRVVFEGKLTGDKKHGFTPGLHGLHIHAGEDITTCGNGTTHLMGHMQNVNGNAQHGHPTNTLPNRHPGDLGNIFVNRKGTGDVWITDTIVSLDRDHDYFIGGRGMVLHEKVDDFVTPDTGNAGFRVGCCIISDIMVIN